MGAVGAIAPTVSETVGASTHGFLVKFVANPSIFIKKGVVTISYIVILWQKLKSSTHSPNEVPVYTDSF